MRRTFALALALVALCVPTVAQAAGSSYVRDPLTNRLAQKPKTLSFRDVDLTSLRWTHWGWNKAIGRGNANVLICEPSCADGRRVRGKVRVVLRKRTTEGDRRVYQCIEARITGVPKAYSKISWQC